MPIFQGAGARERHASRRPEYRHAHSCAASRAGSLAPRPSTSDGARVVFTAPVDGKVKLFEVAIAGGPLRRINAPLIGSGDVTSFELGAQGNRILCRADQDEDEVFELFHSFLTPLYGRP